MPFLSVYVTAEDLADLHEASRDLGRSVEDLAEAAVAEAVCRAKNPPQDPRQRSLEL